MSGKERRGKISLEKFEGPGEKLASWKRKALFETPLENKREIALKNVEV